MLPFDLTGLTYYFLIVTNVRKDIFESSYDNNDASKLVNIQILPAVDLFVTNVTSSQLNVTYFDDIVWSWTVANNGSIATTGQKCDSVYMSSDTPGTSTMLLLSTPSAGSSASNPKDV